MAFIGCIFKQESAEFSLIGCFHNEEKIMIITPLDAIAKYLEGSVECDSIPIADARNYTNILIELALKGKRSDFYFHKALFEDQVMQMIIDELREAGYTVTPSQGLIKCYFPRNTWDKIKSEN